MALTSSSAQPFCRPASARTIGFAPAAGVGRAARIAPVARAAPVALVARAAPVALFARAAPVALVARAAPVAIVAGAASNPRASRFSVGARTAVPLRAEDVPRRIDDADFVPSYTTLHDGEQSTEDIMSSNDKLLRVATIKVGFSVNSSEAVRSIVMEVPNTSIVVEVENTSIVICFVPGCNRGIDAASEVRNRHLDISLATSKVLKLRVKAGQVVNIAEAASLDEAAINGSGEIARNASSKVLKLRVTAEQEVDIAEAASLDEATINGSGERARNAPLDVVVLEITAVNIRESSTMTSKMEQEHSGLHAQTHKATVGANDIAHESGIHQDLNGMLKFKGISQTGSTHGNEFDNGKLSGSHAFGTILEELGYDKEIKDPCKCVNEDAEGKKPPTVLESYLKPTITYFLPHIGKQSLEYIRSMWPMVQVQPCLRVIAFFVLGITLAVGLAAMYCGAVVRLKAESTSHSA